MLPRVRRPAGHLVAALCLAAAAGCGGASSAPVPEPRSRDSCLIPDRRARGASRAGRCDEPPEDSSAVAPDSRSRWSGSTAGAPRPAAAASWTADSAHRAWTFVLAPPRSASPPAPSRSEWRARPLAATLLRQAGVSSVTPLDQRRLVVTMDRSSDSVPTLFADPALSIRTDSLAETGTTFLLRRVVKGDLRDAIDGGADIVRSGDPAIAEYARSRAGFTVHPLPWSRTYLLLLPAGREGFDDLVPGDTADFRTALARDAVRAEARGAEPSAWWDPAPTCPQTDLSRRLACRRRDRVHRLPGRRRSRPRPRRARGRVVRRSGSHDSGCSVMGHAATVARRIRPRVHRRRAAGALGPLPRPLVWPPDVRVVPLIDTRLNAVVRRGVPPLTVDFDGRIRPADAP